MAIAKLKFDLTNLDDSMEFRQMMNAGKMYSALFEIVFNTKKCCLNESENWNELATGSDGVELVFEKIANILDEHNINLDELTI